MLNLYPSPFDLFYAPQANEYYPFDAQSPPASFAHEYLSVSLVFVGPYTTGSHEKDGVHWDLVQGAWSWG